MPSQYLPNAGNNPTHVPRLSDGDPPVASSVNPSIEALADMIASRAIRLTFVNVAAMQANTTPLVEGDYIACLDLGIYKYSVAGTPWFQDFVFILDATGLGAGQYVHITWGLVASGRIAALGTVPGGVFTAANGVLPYQSASVARSNGHVIRENGQARWSLGASGIWTQLDITSQGLLLADLAVPHNCHLTSISVAYKGNGGHGILPANKPNVTLYENNPGAGTSTQISNLVVDPSPNVAAYEGRHDITVNKRPDGVTPLDWAIDAVNKSYVLSIQGESGAGAATTLQLFGITAIFTVTEQDKG